MTRERANSKPTKPTKPTKRIKARDGDLSHGYFSAKNLNTITAARPPQVKAVTDAIQKLSSQHANTSSPQSDTSVAASNSDIDMADSSEASSSANPNATAISESPSKAPIRKRAFPDGMEEPTASTVSRDVTGNARMRTNIAPGEKRRKRSEIGLTNVLSGPLDKDEAIKRSAPSANKVAFSNSANDQIEKAKPHTGIKSKLSSSQNVTKKLSKLGKAVISKQGAKQTNNAVDTESTSKDATRATTSTKEVAPPGTRTVRSRQVTKKVYVTKEFLTKWQVRPVKRPFQRFQALVNPVTNVLPIGIIEAINFETKWFAKILGFSIPGFLTVLPFFATFEFDPDIDAKILKGLKATAADKDLKEVGEIFEESEEEDEDDVKSNQFQSTKVSKTHMIWNGLDMSLPPIHNLPDIFEDMVSKGLDDCNGQQLQKVVDYLGSRKLRIGTMCSGTECPILALSMINDGLTRKGRSIISFVHVLSCEIEPFKQAYIQRNFDPEFLFRDVTELSNSQASTAYGSPVNVPGDLDILIAGSSCKDYSGLNNKKKQFEEDGQSRSTFQGVLGYAERYNPRIIILENVEGAPWSKIQAAWDEVGYETFVSKVDTKDYYLPQTRRRGYMVGFNRGVARIANKPLTDVAMTWSKVLESYARRASSPFTKFLYSEDDPRLHQVKRELSISMSLEKARKRIDWIKCRHRYMSFRAAHGLGFRKPLTMWENNGTCKFPDGSWLSWAKYQVERIWDTIDVNFLRCVSQRDYDLQYKTRDLELSQNIDRDNDTRPWGMIGCVTPSGIPYLTTQRRPISGQESLALQGIPTDTLSLAYETSRQLQDFAGNAMSSTVVGAAMLAALGVGHMILQTGPVALSRRERMRDTPLGELVPDNAGQRFSKNLLCIGPTSSKTFGYIRELASCTMQLCSCEGRFECKRCTFQDCLRCGHRTCITCGQNPLHRYEPIPTSITEQRKEPSEFERVIRRWLPLQFCFGEIDYATLYGFGAATEGSTEARTLTAIRDALENPVHLVSFRRTEFWTAIYEGSYARLEIVFGRKWDGRSSSSKTLAGFLGKTVVQCYLYAKAGPEEPANSPLRAILAPPVARMTCEISSKLEGKWVIRIPKKAAFKLNLEQPGPYVDSWEKKLDLKDTMFSLRKVSKQIRVSLADGLNVCPEGILGTYELLEDCGTACGSLYRKLDDTDFKYGLGPEPIFFFLDPGELQNATEDSFVFATTCHQLRSDGTRDVIAEVKKGWRPVSNLPSISEILLCKVSGLWQVMCGTHLDFPQQDPRIQRWLPTWGAPADIDLSRCTQPGFTALICSFPLQRDRHRQWIPGNAYAIDLVDKPNALQPFTQIVQRAGHDCGFTSWISIPPPNSALTLCKTCAPTKPRLVYPTVQSSALARYIKSKSDKPFLVEDQRQAFGFEKQIRARPSPVVADLHCHKDGTGTLKVQLNAVTLIHRAYAKLISQSSKGNPISSIQWRLVTETGFEQLLPFSKPSLLGNAGDCNAGQPPNWNKNKKLHLSQLRSLHWMLEQESNRAKRWVEQETEEVCIPSADLRLEAKVECERQVRGGVLADEVGYGKTAVTLALFDSDASKADGTQRFSQPTFAKGDKKIKIKATLVLAPVNLLEQWHSEVKLFLNRDYDTLEIKSENDLFAVSFERMYEADIVLSTWEVFGERYFKELAYFGRSPQVPKQYGRAFQQWLARAVENTDTLVERSEGCRPSLFWPTLQTMAVIKSGNEGLDVITSANGKEADNELNEDIKKRLDNQFKLVDMKVRKTLKIVPLLHFFSFHRIVTDEFTYVAKKELAATLQLAATRKWILSGTPPLESFRDINSMAMFLGTKLSTDDNDGGVYESQAALKEKMKDKTEAEKFHFYSYQTLHSPTWYHERHQLAEKFVAQFIRQNTPDLTKVPLSIHYEVVSLSAAERATYFELFQLLMNRPVSFSTTGKEQRTTDGNADGQDRTQRLLNMASTSRSPEEALLICCSTPMSIVNGVEADERTASRVCRAIVAEKNKHFCVTGQKLLKQLTEVFEVWELGYKDDAAVIPHFYSYIRSLHNNEFGDEIARAVLERLMTYAQAAAVEAAVKWNSTPSPASSSPEGKNGAAESLDTSTNASRDNDDDDDEDDGDNDKEAAKKQKSSISDLSKLGPRKKFIFQASANLTNLSFGLAEHLRGLRFFNTIESYVNHDIKPKCSGCLEKATTAEKTLIMGICGHASCVACFEKKQAQRKLLDECVAARCEAPAHAHSAFRLSDLDRATADLQHPFGSKIDAVLELLQDKERVTGEDRVVIFVQFERLKTALVEGLNTMKITHVDGSRKGKVENFKKGKEKVCILDPESVDAAGWNLQMANHVIFLSSLVVDTQYKYESMMTQARGRVYRQRQEKRVHIYYFLAARTMDVNILQDRTEKILVQRDGEYLLLPATEVKEGDEQGFAGAPFEGAACRFEE